MLGFAHGAIPASSMVAAEQSPYPEGCMSHTPCEVRDVTVAARPMAGVRVRLPRGR
jgi:hypothetical protein